MALTSHRTRRLLLFISKPLLSALFVTALLRLIFYPSSSSKKPINPHPHLSKALILATTASSNLTWLTPSLIESTHWDTYIYNTSLTPSLLPQNSRSSPSQLTVPLNKGNEAMPYLTFLTTHYHTLPSLMFFHHDHSQAWHQPFSSSFELRHLNPLTVLRDGYVSPRCLPGCENVIELSGDVVPLEEMGTATREVQISTLLHNFWLDKNGNRQKIPEKIAAPCCAQFAVSREAVRRRSLAEWEALRDWLVQTELGSRQSGRLLEWTWHLWFGKEAVFCPEEEKCLCDVYGVGECGGEL